MTNHSKTDSLNELGDAQVSAMFKSNMAMISDDGFVDDVVKRVKVALEN